MTQCEAFVLRPSAMLFLSCSLPLILPAFPKTGTPFLTIDV
jgi:hypothetical protein